MVAVLVAIFLGWNLGANDAANIFGTAVSSKMIKFWIAAILASLFVILGAVIGGEKGIETYQSIMNQDNIQVSILISLAAGLSVLIMTKLKIPVSTTHCILAGLIVAGSLNGDLNMKPVIKMLMSWVISPLSVMIIAYIIYIVFLKYLRVYIKNMIVFEMVIRVMAIIVGIYGSYSLGANNVANVVGVFVKQSNIDVHTWLLIGGLSIAFGIITYSKRVMGTVGTDITKLDSFGALTAVFATAIVIHIYSMYGVPVSSSQGIVGGVIGVGLVEGFQSINKKVIKRIVLGWFYSIVISGTLSYIFLNFFT